MTWIITFQLEDTRCTFCPGRNTADQTFTLSQNFEKSWDYAEDVYICFVDLAKAYDTFSREKLWGGLGEKGVDGHLLLTVQVTVFLLRSLSPCQRRANTKPSAVSAGLRYGSALTSRSSSCSHARVGNLWAAWTFHMTRIRIFLIQDKKRHRVKMKPNDKQTLFTENQGKHLSLLLIVFSSYLP